GRAQRAAARRADERPRHGHPRRRGGPARRLAGHAGRRLARPVPARARRRPAGGAARRRDRPRPAGRCRGVPAAARGGAVGRRAGGVRGIRRRSAGRGGGSRGGRLAARHPCCEEGGLPYRASSCEDCREGGRAAREDRAAGHGLPGRRTARRRAPRARGGARRARVGLAGSGGGCGMTENEVGPLDAIDRALVDALRNDGRTTLAVLSEISGLSLSAVQVRVRKLEARGVSTGYRAVVNPEAVGVPLSAFVEITPLDQAQEDDAPDRLRGMPGIESCYSVAGNANYLLTVRVASPRALEELLGRIRRTAQVSTRTTVVLQTYFEGQSTEPGR